ncbi:uncharacterized protein LOC142358601 isoform X2 [Convolutriloba macropyga]|uniref:uncharacterized protein LOC142358601 isoform X2 n=1 Tax=Convolutriloba macropyga TaxID=536237 RepID=UPI003F5286A0
MQTSDQEVPKLLYLLEQATLNDERFDSARTMDGKSFLNWNAPVDLGSLIDIISDNDEEELEMIHMNSETRGLDDEGRKQSINKTEDDKLVCTTDSNLQDDVLTQLRNEEICSLIAALSSAAVAGNVAVAGTNLNSLLNIGGGTKDMASVSTDPKSSRINASTSCGDIRTNNNNSGKGASNNSCRRSRAIPNKILSCNLSHSTASGAPIGVGVGLGVKTAATAVMIRSGGGCVGSQSSAGYHHHHLHHSSPPCKRIKLHHRPCLDFEKMHKQKQSQEQTASLHSYFSPSQHPLPISSGSAAPSPPTSNTRGRSSGHSQNTNNSHMYTDTAVVTQTDAYDVILNINGTRNKSLTRGLSDSAAKDDSGSQTDQSIPGFLHQLPHKFISHQASDADSKSNVASDDDDGRDSLSHMEEQIADAVASQQDIINPSETPPKYSGNISYTEVTERTESNDSAYGSDFGVERHAIDECVKQQSAVFKELPMDKVQNQIPVLFDGNGNMVSSDKDQMMTINFQPWPSNEGLFSSKYDQENNQKGASNSNRNISFRQNYLSKSSFNTCSTSLRHNSRSKVDSPSYKFGGYHHHHNRSKLAVHKQKSSKTTATSEESSWTSRNPTTFFTPIHFGAPHSTIPLPQSRNSPTTTHDAHVNNLAFPVSAACTSNAVMFGGAFRSLCTTGTQ